MQTFQQVRFAWTFRTYQQAVLDKADAHLRDGHIHIVAAPGSGKTILGLELVRRLGKPALILAPSVTIRRQWGERFAECFMPKGAEEADFVSEDLHTPQLAVMCGVPVYCDGVFKGVAGAGMYLDLLSRMIEHVDLGDKGNICIVNDLGRILFSNLKTGSLSVEEGTTDLRLSANDELRSLVNEALSGKEGVKQLLLDGAQCYAAYAPMKTVGWSVFVVLAKDEVDAPTIALQNDLDRIASVQR